MSYRPRRYPKHKKALWRALINWYPNMGSDMETTT